MISLVKTEHLLLYKWTLMYFRQKLFIIWHWLYCYLSQHILMQYVMQWNNIKFKWFKQQELHTYLDSTLGPCESRCSHRDIYCWGNMWDIWRNHKALSLNKFHKTVHLQYKHISKNILFQNVSELLRVKTWFEMTFDISDSPFLNTKLKYYNNSPHWMKLTDI